MPTSGTPAKPEDRQLLTAKERQAEEEEQNKSLDLVAKSVTLRQDERFLDMQQFQGTGPVQPGTLLSGETARYPEAWGYPEAVRRRMEFQRVDNSPRPGPRPRAEDICRYTTEDFGSLDMDAIAQREVSGYDRQVAGRFRERTNWDASFRARMNRLMTDFDFSTDPKLRLNHMERLNEWYEFQSKRGDQKETPSPNFLTFNSDSQTLPGSARDLAAPTRTATLNLASVVKMPRSPRLDRQLALPSPPRPAGGYK